MIRSGVGTKIIQAITAMADHCRLLLYAESQLRKAVELVRGIEESLRLIRDSKGFPVDVKPVRAPAL